MPVEIREKYTSRRAVVNPGDPSVELEYIVSGTEDDAVVRSLVSSTVPPFYLGLIFRSYSIEPLGGGHWDVKVSYGRLEHKETGDSSFSFEISGQSTHITQSISTINKYPGTAPSFDGAIGMSSDRIEGTDIQVPTYSFSETHYIPISLVTPAYKAAIFGVVAAPVNQFSFRGFAPGEVLFLGASGSQRGQDDWEITFRFSASPNVTGLTVGSITGIDKKGWEYLWVRYADKIDGNNLVKKPVAVYIEQVYRSSDYAVLGIGS